MDGTTLGLVTAIVTSSTTLTAIVVKQFVTFFLTYMRDSMKLKDEQAERKDEQAERSANRFIDFLTTLQENNTRQNLAWAQAIEDHTEASKTIFRQNESIIKFHELLVPELRGIREALDTMIDMQKDVVDMQNSLINSSKPSS